MSTDIIPAPATTPAPKRKKRRDKIKRQRIVDPDSERVQIQLPPELVTRMVHEVAAQGCLSLSELYRRILVGYFQMRDKGQTANGLDPKTIASLRETVKLLREAVRGQEILFSALAQLLIATENEHLLQEALTAGSYSAEFREALAEARDSTTEEG